MKIERIKFATSVMVDSIERLYVDAKRERVDVEFSEGNNFYVLTDRHNRRMIVHPTNVQWAQPADLQQTPVMEVGLDEVAKRPRGRPRLGRIEKETPGDGGEH